MGLILGAGTTKPQYPYDMWYGVQGDFTSKDYLLTRVGNLDLHKTLPIQSAIRRFVENDDGSVKYYLHQNDSRKTEGDATAILDSTDGNVMLEIPAYYQKIEFSGTKWIYAISQYPLPGFTLVERKTISPWFATIDQANSKAVSGSWLTWNGDEIARDANGYVVYASNAANFRGGNNASTNDASYNSLLGMPRTSMSKAGFRTYCKNGTHLGAYRAYNEIGWLARIEYASFYCQDKYNATLDSNGYHQGGLGDGTTTVDGGVWYKWNGYNPFIPCGVTATLGNNTGQVQYLIKSWSTNGDFTDTVTSYRGLEAPFNYLWMLADDVLMYNDTANSKAIAYVCEDPTKFISPADNDANIPDGYKAITNMPCTTGWIGTDSISDKGYSFPLSLGGGANSGITDYYYYPGTQYNGWFGALFSAHAGNGAFSGFGYLSAYFRSSTALAYIGFRLCRF
jgi:hypothetical protein